MKALPELMLLLVAGIAMVLWGWLSPKHVGDDLRTFIERKALKMWTKNEAAAMNQRRMVIGGLLVVAVSIYLILCNLYGWKVFGLSAG